MGRRIKAGSKAIKILAPFTKKIVEKNADGLEEERVFTYFVPVNVFDVSQTQGKELPRIEIEVLGENQQGLLKKLIEFCDSKKILIEFKTMDKQLYGYSAGGKIAINSNQSINSQANTLIHEIAHELLHQNANAFSKKEQETQAEAITYIITKHFGLENKSSNYLALHKAEAKQIMQTLAQISETVQEIIGYLETNTAIKGEVSASI